MYCNPAKARKKNLSADMLSPSFSNPNKKEKKKIKEKYVFKIRKITHSFKSSM